MLIALVVFAAIITYLLGFLISVVRTEAIKEMLNRILEQTRSQMERKA